MGCASSTPVSVLQATLDGDLAAVQRALNAGKPVSETDERGATALHYAAEQAAYEIASVLVEAGAQVEARSLVRHRPLRACVPVWQAAAWPLRRHAAPPRRHAAPPRRRAANARPPMPSRAVAAHGAR